MASSVSQLALDQGHSQYALLLDHFTSQTAACAANMVSISCFPAMKQDSGRGFGVSGYKARTSVSSQAKVRTDPA